jgi:4-diphosphocytidyl-2-C-methyl-D-erythritol kinase
VSTARACAKLNLGLVVGPRRPDGKHEVATVLQRIDLCDTVTLAAEPEAGIVVEGFADTIVRRALAAYAESSETSPGWRVEIEKRIPVAAGLGGGSSDAAAALRLANEVARRPLVPEELHALAARIGADVPFFLRRGPQLATGDGSELAPVSLPLDYWIVVALPAGIRKESTEVVYDRFDERGGAAGFDARRTALLAALGGVREARKLAALPENDLATSPLATQLGRRGAFRADVSGAGPAVYGLFQRRGDAESAASGLGTAARTWIAQPIP